MYFPIIHLLIAPPHLLSAPQFACSGILPIKMLYFKFVASLLHDIENHCAPPNISELFTRSEQVYS